MNFADLRYEEVEMLTYSNDEDFLWDLHGQPVGADPLLFKGRRKWTWKKLYVDQKRGDHAFLDSSLPFFLILRIADHPGGTNRHCIGLQELANTYSLLWAPFSNLGRLYPDEAPEDFSDFLELPVRCICGRLYPTRSLNFEDLDMEKGEAICPNDHGCRKTMLGDDDYVPPGENEVYDPEENWLRYRRSLFKSNPFSEATDWWHWEKARSTATDYPDIF
ncbi:hypothetical protein CVT26_001004 [Gymnopilus dilepis]|uniref:Uncharacterized protein n=1 Tax=Gymnopilus dilepis TaxID=231916 RepID=A0A409YUI1_9AGAR|nr:hypothetical protein CVT26_001004 [Gymnopilus dilepis]